MTERSLVWMICLILCRAYQLSAQSFNIFEDTVLVASFSQTDEAAITKAVNNRLLKHWKEGYVFAQAGSYTDSTVYIHLGERKSLRLSRVINSASGDTLELQSGKSAISAMTERLSTAANNGYPFAQAKLESLHVEDGVYLGELVFDPGPYIAFDTLRINDDIQTSTKYLEHTLEVDRDRPYAERDWSNLVMRMDRLPYLSLRRPPEIVFFDHKAQIHLDLEEQDINSFEGIIGMLPNQNSGNLLITGYLDLQLNNLFSTGKSFSFNWNRFAEESQQLDLKYEHPYFLETRLLLKFNFDLLKQDTTFINQEMGFHLGTHLGSSGRMYSGYSRSTGNLISGIRGIDNLLDYQRDIYSLDFDWKNYDIPLKFESGWKVKTSISLGSKKLITDPNQPDSFYDSLRMRSNLAMMTIGFRYQKILHRQTAIYQQVQSGHLYNDNVLRNEMYRIGGLLSVRGFNEQFFFAEQYALSRLEIRQYFERSSYFMLFYDQLIYRQGSFQDDPFGIGIGFTLSTDNGLFNFAMALGKSEDIAFDLANTKIHFGYVSTF